MFRSRYTTYALVGASFVLIAWIVHWAGDILSPFIIGFILAYLGHPVVTKLTGRRLPRSVAAFIVTFGLVALVSGIIALIGPIIYDQFVSLLRSLPEIMDKLMATLHSQLLPYFPMLEFEGVDAIAPDMDVKSIAGPLASSVLAGGLSLVTPIGLALLIPVITFYLLVDWPEMISRIHGIIPYRSKAAAEGIAQEMDMALSGFLRGQAYVCMAMAVIYSMGLIVAGLDYGLLIGVVSGFLKYLPYIGTAIGVLLAFLIGFAQGGWDPGLMLGITATYAIGEFIESSILTPKLVGMRVQLPPVVVIFAVLLGGKLLGLIGIFIAVPIFATGRVIVGEWLSNGGAPPPEP